VSKKQRDDLPPCAWCGKSVGDDIFTVAFVIDRRTRRPRTNRVQGWSPLHHKCDIAIQKRIPLAR
jgi:hypothetical protein